MKRRIINLFLLPALMAGLGLIPAGRARAQTFTTLHSFGPILPGGAGPTSGLILSGNTLYGTAYGGGSSNGTVFAVQTDGTGFTNLYSFTAGSGALGTNSDGASPGSGFAPGGRLVLAGNTLYGTAQGGGSSGAGTVFAVNTNGTGFTNLHSFAPARANSSGYLTNSDGADAADNLILSGNTLYGSAIDGGGSGVGTLFRVNTDGTGFTNLHSFTAAPAPDYTNSDGTYPVGDLIFSGNTLYGTADSGGTSGGGTVFKVSTDGTGFTVLYNFTAASGALGTNSDGGNPDGGLVLLGNTLYGTAAFGGDSGSGTVFKVNTNGTGFTNLHSFAASGTNFSDFPTNSDGASPWAGLILSGSTLYGTAYDGSGSGSGTVFAVNTDGTGFTSLYSFTEAVHYYTNGTGGIYSTNSDGANPYAGLILSGSTLYGTATRGGSSGDGTVFSLLILPQLTIIRSGANVILTWPTNAVGFNLQSSTNLISPAVWTTNSPGPIVANGQYTVTNPISGTRKFYRLSQ
jgi:uncharacterized repeat protein (TIGR03803 family)